MINLLSLYSSIFLVSPTINNSLSATPAPYGVSESAASILHALLHPSEQSPIPPVHPTFLSPAMITSSTKARLYLAAALTPFKDIQYMDVKKKEHQAVEAVIREGLKLGIQNHYLDGVPLLFTASKLLRDPNLDSDKFSGPSQRAAIGMHSLFISRICFTGPSHRLVITRESCP
jgi:tRNA nucleotidyltransferase (CCA-adding enzyme)